METVTMRLEQLFQGFREDSYPGEYLDFVLHEKLDLVQLEEIASVLASYSKYWNDRDVTIFNNNQRMRIFSHLAGYAEESAAIAASLSVLSEADGESNEPFFQEEKRRKQAEKYLLLAKSATKVSSAIAAAEIRPILLRDYRELLLSFLEKADPYKDEGTLYKLVCLSKRGRERLKSRIVTALSKLLNSNVTPASSAYKTLSQRFTDREIRYLNLKWFRGTHAIQDKVIAQFLSSLLIHESRIPINDWEKMLFREYGTKEFSHNIQGSCKPYDYLCWEYLLKNRPSVLQDEESWKLAYELYSAEDITANKSFLKFNPMEKENFRRIICIKSKKSQIKLINSFAPQKKQNAGVLIPEYTEEEKTYARRMKQIFQNLFGDNFMYILDEHYCYQAMTFLCQTEVIPEPDKVTNWVEQLRGGYGVCCTVRVCRRTSTAPIWLVRHYDGKSIINMISRKNMCGVSKKMKREFIGQLFDALYQEQPYYYVATLMKMFKEDWKWKNPKEGESPEPEFQLTDFFTEEEIRILVSGLKNKRLTPEEEACINHYRMNKEEYEIWKSRKDKIEKKKKDQKTLCELQNNANNIFKNYLKNNCEAVSMEWCYWSHLCNEPGRFRELFERPIVNLATMRAIEKFKESGVISVLLNDMAEISKSKEGVKRLLELTELLENTIKKGESHGSC